MGRQILWDEYFRQELDREIMTYDTRERKDWKAALDSIVNKAFPGTGEDYQIVFINEQPEQKKPKKRKKR